MQGESQRSILDEETGRDFLTQKSIALLKRLGFNELESEVYLTVLKEPGLTGYRVAQLLGKPVPNAYKVLDMLEAKGAVVSDDSGRSRLYSAVPVDEFVDQMVRGLEESRRKLRSELENVGKPPPEEGIYRLLNTQQVYTKAERMIDSASESLLVDIDPVPLRQLEDRIVAAAAGGVKTLVHAHSDSMDVELEGCEVINSCKIDWPGEWLVVLVDGSEYLISIITPDERRVYQAVWSRNPFISPCIYQGYLNRAILYRTLLMFGAKKSREEISTELYRLWGEFAREDPGTAALRELLDSL